MKDDKLRKLEYEYRLLSENALECIWVFDIRSQKFTYMSPNVTALRGISVEEAMQESLADAVPQESYETAVENTKKMIALYLQGERRKEMLTTVRDMQIYTTGGAIKQIEVTVRLIQNPETGAFEMLGVTRDITERKQLEDQLTQALASKSEIIASLEKSEKALKQLTGELNKKNKALRELAVRDSLTDIYNRYYFDRKVIEETERCQRYAYPLTMMLFDIDNFKAINDTCGHDVGDHVLRLIADTAGKAIRRQDMLARWGGEEFVILMPHTNLQAAEKATQKLCRALEALRHPDVSVPVTASFGVTEFMHGETNESWFRRVDHAMFCSKDKGGNCVTALNWIEAFPYAKVSLIWKDEWESGNAAIDSQHKTIIALANQTMDAMLDTENGHPARAMQELLAYTRVHFDAEEALLRDIRYPRAQQHIAIHAALWNSVANLNRQYAAGELSYTTFFSFLLDDVIIGHMQKDDFRFFPYLKKHGQPAPA